MKLHAMHRRIASREKNWVWAAWGLAPLSLVWILAGALRRSFRETFPGTGTRVPAVVVSVGNIELGGTGKTPVTVWIAERLQKLGISTAVVARNLAVRRGLPVAVLPGHSWGGSPLSDEPLMMGARLHPGCRVFAGPDKTETALRAFKEISPEVILIDDGFQHLKLHRDLEVVVLNADHPFGIGGVFPMGTLREPPSVLSRADFLWLNRVTTRVSEKLARRLISQKNWKAPFVASRPVPMEPLEPDGTRGKPCEAVAFCGIGNPESFRATLEEAGFRIPDFLAFPDHWNYTPADGDNLREALRRSPAERLVTTEKDAARLGKKGMRELNPLVLPMDLEVHGSHEELLGRILDLVQERGAE